MPPQLDLEMDWSTQNAIKKDGHWTVDGRPVNKHEVAWHETPSNVPGSAYIGLKVTSPVNAATPPHRHGGAAVAATVIRGRMLNQMVCADGHVVGPQVYEQGETWYEPPGCHHVRCENAGDEEAVFIAAFVIDDKLVKEKGLLEAAVQIDAEMEERARDGRL